MNDQADVPVWGIHTGRPRGQSKSVLDRLERPTDQLFKDGYIALGWPQVGDLSRIPSDRGAFRDALIDTYGPNDSSRSNAADAGMLYRFVHEMQIGDLVVFRSSVDKLIHIGRVSGPYVYDPSGNEEYHHLSAVEWLGSFDRSEFSDDARRTFKARRSLYQVQSGADEFRTIVRPPLS